ncbi:Gfo/Idh/MocA family oxidoreductase [Arthrobacter flavus]|uniref:Gfo/Idh/MocA family protein n=1 Tax=Arthrobacter flavus TaxID=95172 RepID=A0ABW4QAS3_9MICC
MSTNFGTTPALRVAILSFAHTHAQGYAAVLKNYPGVELLASDPGDHPEGELRGAALAQQLGLPYVDTYEELFAWSPDAVIITSENTNHRADVELAASHGAHILCEKPLATTVSDARAMIAACEDARVNLMVAYPVRFSSAFDRLKKTNDAGHLGRLLSIRGSNNGKLPREREWFTQPALSGGGALVDHVVHIADLLDALMGSSVTSVTAVANQILYSDRAEAETGGLVNLTYENGTIASIDCSWSEPDSAPTWGGLKINVAGTKGSVDVDFFGPRIRGLETSTGKPVELPYSPNLDATLLESFLTSVRTGHQAQPDGYVGLRTLEIVTAAQRSIQTGETISLPRATD